jgi:alcohol dehydrogenase (cytochrome c)
LCGIFAPASRNRPPPSRPQEVWCSATPDRYFRAFDDRDGKVLWESPRLNDIPNAFPITYMVDGKQYIAMPVGNPGLQGNSALYTAPEHGAVRGSKSSVLWVWQLP